MKVKWWFSMRRCLRCGNEFAPQRQAQAFCSKQCRDAIAQRRHRHRSADSVQDIGGSADRALRHDPAPLRAIPEPDRSHYGTNPDGSTPGALPDDYPLEYYSDGFPKIPDCLRRVKE